MTVFLVADHEVVRRGVREMLSVESDIEVVGEAGTAADALVRIPATRPDVAVLDVRLPDGSGVEMCREIRSRDDAVKCLMLTSYADDEALFDAIMAGASGYVLKAIRGQELLTAVRDVAVGKSLLDPVGTARVLRRLREGAPKADDRLAHLTDQERGILDLIGEGLTDRQIAGTEYGRVAAGPRAMPFLASARHIVTDGRLLLRMHRGHGYPGPASAMWSPTARTT
ncbi:response regulator [Streptomyces sp. NPDC058295]|uniref:response regulator n=1 Tax=Streptomyces sp. NPDC058295 TaxID=3346431 RepID=UPI0036E5F687